MGSLIGKLTGTTKAAKRSAEAQRAAADMAKYKPYDIEGSFFGDVDFEGDTASYTLSPELQKFRDYLYSESLGFAPTEAQRGFFSDVSQQGQDIFNRGMGADIDKMTSDYYNQQLRMLAPERAAEDVRVAERLYGTGRTGLGTSVGTGGYINPELYSKNLAREQANLGLLMGSEDRARALQQADLSQGLGLFGLGQELKSQPIASMYDVFGKAAGIEQLGMTPLTMGVDIGSAAQAGRLAQAQGYSNAANTRLQADQANIGMFTNLLGQAAGAYGPSIGSALGSAFSGPSPIPRGIGAGGVGGYGSGMFSNFNVGR